MLRSVIGVMGILRGLGEFAGAAELQPHNTRVPFCFQVDGRRSWRITTSPPGEDGPLLLEVIEGED